MPPQIAVNSDALAAIFEDHVDIFGLSLPLDRGRLGGTGYHSLTGEVSAFRIEQIIIKFNGQEIPVTSLMYLHRDGSFHGAVIRKGVRFMIE